MAESQLDKVHMTNTSSIRNDNSVSIECAVCLQPSVHPAELPCGHIFCYLCIKGIASQSRRCAMCRQDIPVDYLDKPRLLKPVDIENSSKGFEDGHLWFYEGHNGWWQYDERTSQELESAYQKGERCCELLIAGFLYIADFDKMLQYRRSEPNRRRRIKRDLATILSKGVAGLKAAKDCSTASTTSPTEAVSNVLMPDLHILHFSGRHPLNQSSVRNFTSLTNLNSLNSNFPQTVGSQTMSQWYSDRNSSRILQINGRNISPSNNIGTTTNSDSLSSRNVELDTAIHDTLDWTIEQIEALNSELSNEYENLFSDVSNCRK
ncbi:hypothetical protein RUM44_008048 [Polyplax serrata]|uniref:E3 ubiquitin-protein ligase n=1 Tax=Polyplax serrata TaxID=468196 RepID=A0ABR1B7L5_POLSC